MKAIIFTTFGSSSVLKIGEVERPVPKQNEVLIKISHTSVNPVDWKIREGYMQEFIPHRLPIIPGWDVSGEIIEVGSNVHSFKIGDLVYSYARQSEVHSGTYAEFIALPQESVCKKPYNLKLEDAASVPLVALTAYQCIYEVVKIKAGEKILITAGSGGVGSFAIQFAKLAKAKVTATSGTKNIDYLKKLGADSVIDYTKEDFEVAAKKIEPNGFDVIFDCVGGDTLNKSYNLLNSNGRLVSIVEQPKIGSFHFVYPSGEQLDKIKSWFENEQLQAPFITVMNIKNAALAQDENQKRHVSGKIVLNIEF